VSNNPLELKAEAEEISNKRKPQWAGKLVECLGARALQVSQGTQTPPTNVLFGKRIFRVRQALAVQPVSRVSILCVIVWCCVVLCVVV
jgi:hypothetical protein